MKHGNVEKHHWRLWMWGDKEEMLNRMGVLATQDRDVWVIDPDEHKHHPDGIIEAHA